MRKYFSVLLLGACLCAPAMLPAQDDRHEHDRDKKYYDPYKRDYHEWNENENRAWRHYVTEERRGEFHDWDRANKREQRDYWRWRHDHPDWDRH